MTEQAQEKSLPAMEYMIHNTSRSRHNRTHRAALPQNPSMKQFVGAEQRRLIRGRPICVSEEMLKSNLEELRTKQAQHTLEVRTRDGRLVDLTTLKAAPLGPVETKPHPPLDSVANDRNFPLPDGYKFVPTHLGDDATMPQLVPAGEKPALLKESEAAEPATDEAPIPDAAAASVEAVTPESAAAAVDAELDAALEAAQAEATEPATAEPEDATSGESQKRGRRSRR